MIIIESLFASILEYSLNNNCSDIHFDFNNENALVSIRARGSIKLYSKIDYHKSIKLFNYILYKANLDIVNKNLLHTGSIEYKYQNNIYYLRVSLIPTNNSKSIVIRILNNSTKIAINDLSIIKNNVDQINKILSYKSGMVIFTGKTGSGKTTSMYAVLEQLIKDKTKKIITLEDPVERKIEGILQISINNEYTTYFNVLKQVLRHDPDIIVIGEIRDEQDLKLAVQAALSGHLVLTSMHSISAIFAINRLLELNIAQSDLKACIQLISYQELLYTSKHKPFSIYEFIDNKDINDYLQNKSIYYRKIEEYKKVLNEKVSYYEGK